MNKVINIITKKIVNIIVTHKQKKRLPIISLQLERNLSCLMPGKNRQQLVCEYYNKKVRYLLLIFISICIFIILYIINQRMNPQIIDNYYLLRNDYGNKSRYLDIVADIEKQEKYDFEVEVKERKYSNKEALLKMKEVINKLPELILNDNESLNHVTSSLNLFNSLNSYPFTIKWESNKYNIIQDDGSIGKAVIDEKGEDITLKALISYQDLMQETFINVRVYSPKLTYEEQTVADIKNNIEKLQDTSIQEEYLELPDSINGRDIEWREKDRHILLFLIILSIIVLIATWIGMDNDLVRKYKERSKSLSLEYSEFVSKLQLLIGSGMTIRGAFKKMGEDYKSHKKEGGKTSFVYEELLLCNKRMQDGLSEAESYDYFGRRCSLICYKKLSTLLIQNLRKGTDGLVYALTNETKIAFEERKQQAKRLGEEAQTKLLFPMILMLTVVMIIIMIPAYMSFGGL